MKKILTRFLITSILAGSFMLISGGRANAATLTVSSGCTLSEALAAVQAAADGSDGCTASGAYGTTDTINIPAGQVTLGSDLPEMNKSLVIQGAGREDTIINANGNYGFKFNFGSSEKYGHDVSISGLTINNASELAIDIDFAETTTLSNIIVDGSFEGAAVKAIHTVVEDSIFRNNSADSNESNAGLGVVLGANVASDVPSVEINDVEVLDNTVQTVIGIAGLGIGMEENSDGSGENGPISNNSITIHNSSILGNQANTGAGLYVNSQMGPMTTIGTALLVDATTIANNSATVSDPVTITPGAPFPPVFAGFFIGGNLTDQQNFTNVTVAYNTVDNPAPDNRNSLAGFFGSLAYDSALLRITNATVVGNTVTQPSALVGFSPFGVIRVDLTFDNNSIAFTAARNGSRSENGLIAQNFTNGVSTNCLADADLTIFGLTGSLDTTPVDLGHNVSDDQTCTGYTYIPNLYDTMDHEIKDNGGPVPTIALHDNSPAANAGGQVLGITTDARGVARTGYYSVGAYQGVYSLSTSTGGGTTVTTAGQLAKTGLVVALATPLGLFLVATPMYLIWDYRRHKQPLLEADPAADYTFWHHLKVVSIPIIRYRLSVSVERKVDSHADNVTRF